MLNWLKNMKFKVLFALFSFYFWAGNALAADNGLYYVQSRGKVICGTDLTAPAYASKTEDGQWKGFDADICRAFSTAIFGMPDKFDLVDIPADKISAALKAHKIDFMLGGADFSAKSDALSAFAPAALLYYDQQAFLARNALDATSMEQFKGAKVCAVSNSADLNNVEEYSLRYDLDINILPFTSENRAKQAFLLNRCKILTGNRIYLQGVLERSFSDFDDDEFDIKLLPEAIALKPVYVLADKNSPKLQAIARWVVNALQLADMYDINAANAKVKIGLKNTSQRNLMGEDPKLWLSFGLTPTWVRDALAYSGNYGEIYERNFGKNSSLKLNRAESNYLKDGGLINPVPFI